MEIKLEAGELYRTRNGRKAFISLISRYDGDSQIAHGIIHGTPYIINWASKDFIFISTSPNDNDLVSKWEEPTPKIDKPARDSIDRGELLRRMGTGIPVDYATKFIEIINSLPSVAEPAHDLHELLQNYETSNYAAAIRDYATKHSPLVAAPEAASKPVAAQNTGGLRGKPSLREMIDARSMFNATTALTFGKDFVPYLLPILHRIADKLDALEGK